MTANKWGLVATFLALLGLGFAAMSINPPFSIPSYLPAIFFIAAGVVFIWLIVLLIRGKKSKQKEEILLELGAKIKSIETYDYYANIFGKNKSGDKKLTLNLVIAISRPVTLNKIALKVWNDLFDIEIQKNEAPFDLIELAPLTITRNVTYTAYCNVPSKFAIKTKECQIYALASDNSEYYSLPIEIDFENTK